MKENTFDADGNLRQKREGHYSVKLPEASELGGIVNRRFLFLLMFVCVAGAATLGYVFQRRLATAAEFDHQLKLAKDEAQRIREQMILTTEKRVPSPRRSRNLA